MVSHGRAFSSDRISQLVVEAQRIVDDFHALNPLRPGVPRARLAEQLGVDGSDLESLISLIPELEAVDAEIRRAGFGADLGTAEQSAWASAKQSLETAGFSPPRRADLRLGVEIEHALIRRGDVVEVSADLFYLPETLRAIVELSNNLADGFTVAEFRDELGITRKHAIPLLEWMDATGVTVREGDGRRIR